MFLHLHLPSILIHRESLHLWTVICTFSSLIRLSFHEGIPHFLKATFLIIRLVFAILNRQLVTFYEISGSNGSDQ